MEKKVKGKEGKSEENEQRTRGKGLLSRFHSANPLVNQIQKMMTLTLRLNFKKEQAK